MSPEGVCLGEGSAFMRVGACADVYTLVWRPEVSRRHWHAGAVCLDFWVRVSCLAWNSAVWLGWMASEPQKLRVFCPSKQRSQMCIAIPAFFIWARSQTQSCACTASTLQTELFASVTLTLCVDGSLLWIEYHVPPASHLLALTPLWLNWVPL